jgi:hypothetical protein
MNFFSHLSKNRALIDRRWCLIGKGPTFEIVRQSGVGSDVSLGLNHVAGELDIDYWHVFDIDVFDAYDESIISRVGYLVVPHVLNEKYKLPLYPHDQHRPMRKSLLELTSFHHILKLFDDAGRLLVYQRGDIPAAEVRKTEDKQSVTVGSFSASTVVNLLARSGVKEIMLAGVDGGARYAHSFAQYESRTLLDSGNSSFDQQFSEIAQTKFDYQISVRHVSWPSPVEVYVGTQNEQKLAFEVLAYSISKHASIDICVFDLNKEIESKIVDFREVTEPLVSGTPFSFQRFAIPELMGYRGLGVYLDSDMLVFDDIRKLLSFSDSAGSSVKAAKVNAQWGREPQLSVMLIDSGRCAWDFRAICGKLTRSELSYQQIFSDDKVLGIDRCLPYVWNSLEEYEEGVTCLIHYTDMRNQPWLSPENKHAKEWCKYLLEYLSYSREAYEVLEDSVKSGWVRPGLRVQASSRIDDPIGMGVVEYLKDYLIFAPPHLAHSAMQLEKKSLPRLLTGLVGRRASYLFTLLVVRAVYLLKLNKLKSLVRGTVKSLKNDLRSRF